MEKLLLCMLLIAGFGCLSGCSSEANEDGTITKGKIVFSTEAGFAPYEEMVDGKLVGIDIDIANAIGEYLDLEVEFANVTFDGALAGTQSGKYDATIAGLSVDADRDKVMDFSTTYSNANLVLVLPTDSTITADDTDGLIKAMKDSGKKFASQNGNTGLDFIKENLGDDFAKGYDAFQTALLDMKNGKVAGIVMDSFPANELVKNSDGAAKVLDIELSVEEYAIAVDEGNKVLLDKINEALASLTKDGTIDEILAKYL